MLKTFVARLLEAELGWAYFMDATNTGKQGELLAVIFFERAEQDHYEPSDVLKTFGGMMNLKTDYSAINKRLSWEDSIMKQQIGDDAKNGRGILHWYGCQPNPQGQQALATLIRSQINYTSIPSYCQEYASEQERINFLLSLGFQPKANMTQEQQDKLVLDSKDDKSPRMSLLEHIPAARDALAYNVSQTNTLPQAQVPHNQA